jgi:microsomal dipeptidase-like Zn-dependent dipeptidase
MSAIALAIASLLSLFVTFIPPAHSWVELHSHAFMEHGMGPFFQGKFTGELQTTSWKQMLKSNLNEEVLLKSKVRIFVVALYAHPVLVSKPKALWHAGVRLAIKRQIQEARAFVARHPESWVLATNPKQAQADFDQGKNLMILSLEGAHSLFNRPEDFDKFLGDKGGIAIVTPVHLIDNKYMGASYMRGLRKTFFTKKHFTLKRKDGAKINPKGVSKKGHAFVQELLRRKIWIDLSHMSDLAMEEVVPLIVEYGWPLLHTHTSLRHFYKAERAISDYQVQLVKEFGGMIGLTPSQEMLTDTRVDKKLCPEACACAKDDLVKFSTHFHALRQKIGEENIAFGSDFNGGIPHLPESDCAKDAGLKERGLEHFAQMPALIQELKLSSDYGDKVARRFLQLWEKGYFAMENSLN